MSKKRTVAFGLVAAGSSKGRIIFKSGSPGKA